jgi:hypothetical protein
LDQQEHGGLVTEPAGDRVFAVLRFLRVPIGSARDLARAHFDLPPVQGLDEPAAGQGEEPLRLRVLMPLTGPTHREDRHHQGNGDVELPVSWEIAQRLEMTWLVGTTPRRSVANMDDVALSITFEFAQQAYQLVVARSRVGTRIALQVIVIA